MRSPFCFITKPVDGQRYNNTKNIGGVDLIISTSEENHLASNRRAQVVALPLNYKGDIRISDILLVHHNVFKYYNDMKGRKRSGKSYFMDELFFVDMEQFYMYNHQGKWHSHDRYCFVKPVDKKKEGLVKSHKEEPLTAIMKYPNKYLKSQGVQVGDQIIFKPDSEYEFDVEGEKLYRMYDHQITVVI